MESIVIIGASSNEVAFNIGLNTKTRLKSLQQWSPIPLKVLCVFNKEGHSTRHFEKKIKEALREKNSYADWYSGTLDELVSIIEKVEDDLDQPTDPAGAVRKWRSKNRQQYNAYMTEYRSPSSKTYKKMLRESPGEILFLNQTAHREARASRLPIWASPDKIRRVYEECVSLADRTKNRYYVIHEIPLSHKDVCGLHVESNLAIVNRYEKETREGVFNQDIASLKLFKLLKEQGY